MPNTIILKKSSVAGKVPLSGDLTFGEVAINYADGKIYYKNTTTNIDFVGNGGTYTNVLRIANSTTTVTPNTGALVVDGGVGIGDTLHVGGVGHFGLEPTITLANPLAVFTGNANGYNQIQIQNQSTGLLASSDIVATANDGDDTSGYIDLGINNSNYSSVDWTMSGARDGYLYVSGNNLTLGTDEPGKEVRIHVGGTLAADVVAIFRDPGTASTSDITGAFNVDGGMGVTGDIHIGETLYIGANPLTNLANTLILGTSNIDGFTQVSIQNRNAGPSASADYVVTADDGDDTTGYIDLGLNNSGYSNVDWTISGPRDGYLYVAGNNLTLGTDSTGTTVKIHVGGTLEENIVATFNEPNTNSTSTLSGSLVVAGGAGIGLDLTVGGTVYSNGVALQNFNTATLVAQAVTAQTSTNAAVAYSLANTSTTYVGRAALADNASLATTATNVGAGSASQILYKNSSNITTGSNGLQYDGVSIKVNGNLESTFSNGDEGGEILLAKPATNTTIGGNGVTIDVYQNKLRFFEQGGTSRGFYIDITSGAINAGTDLVTGSGTPFNGGTITGALTINNSTSATSTNSGALQIINGGAGIGGNLVADQVWSVNNGSGTNFKVGDDAWIGDINNSNTIGIRGQQDSTQGYIVFGNSNSSNYIGRSGTNPITVTGPFNTTGVTKITDTTTASSTITGALVVTGGVGVGGAVYIKNTSFIDGSQILTTATVNSFVTAGVSSVTAGTDTAVSTSTGAVTVWNTSTLQSVTSRGSTTNQIISITNATQSTSTTTGALVVTGGVGISGDVNIAGNLTFAGTATVSAAGGLFFGDDYGFGALYAGIQTFTQLEQTVVQITANTSTFAQVNFQNINSGTEASGDIVLTSSNGDQTTGYIDLGINSENYNSLAYSAQGPNDGYLYVVGANLVIGTASTGTAVKIHVGDTVEENIVVTINEPNTVSTSTNSGALVVTGGAGISGAVYIKDTSFIDGAQILTTATVNSFVTAGVSSVTAGTDTAVSTSTGAITVWNTSTLQSVTSRGSTTNQAISITNTTAATSTTTGALIVSGGAGIAGNVHVGGNIVVKNTAIVGDASTTSILTSAITIDSFAAATYRSAQYIVSISNSGLGEYQTSDVLVVHNGTNSFVQATSVFTGNKALLNFSTTISSGNVLLQGTGNQTGANANIVKIQKTYITI